MFSLPAIQAFVIALIMSAPFMGGDHKPGKLQRSSAWPKGYQKVVESETWHHGFWVNTSDIFFYSGETKALNEMLEGLNKIEEIELSVVLHAGIGDAKSPWGKSKGTANWQLTSSNKDGFGNVDQVKVDVWVGSKVKLAELEIPQKIEVENGNEIESFIKKRTDR